MFIIGCLFCNCDFNNNTRISCLFVFHLKFELVKFKCKIWFNKIYKNIINNLEFPLDIVLFQIFLCVLTTTHWQTHYQQKWWILFSKALRPMVESSVYFQIEVFKIGNLWNSFELLFYITYISSFCLGVIWIKFFLTHFVSHKLKQILLIYEMSMVQGFLRNLVWEMQEPFLVQNFKTHEIHDLNVPNLWSL